MVAIGIDLGTTYTCVVVWKDGGVEVIPNEHGNKTTASYVAFTSKQVIIGDSAKNQAACNALNTVYGAKRLIGKNYDDVSVQSHLRYWPFAVSNDDGKPSIIVLHKKDKKSLVPEEISAMLLHRMKELAESHLETEVKNAVITVPAYFNDAQRQATKTAGVIAGLNVVRILNEPTAAALAYGVGSNLQGIKNVLIYDLGGSTFDVSIVTIENGAVFHVKATAGNTRLGGEDFDNRLVAYFVEDYKKTYGQVLFDDRKAFKRLKNAAEAAKKSLTSSTLTYVLIESLKDGIDYSCKLTREMFEELCSDLFIDTLRPVKQALFGAKMSISDIHDVILVGGSSRIPKIHSILKQFFHDKPLAASINPDEAVAYGAAIQAAILSGQRHERIQDIHLIDVVPLSLGIETAKGLMFKVIEKNTSIPCKRTKEVTTLEDNQTVMTIEVFEGERSLTKDNNLLGVFELSGIPPAPRGIPKIDLIFDVDADGILSVIAQDRSTGHNNGIVIKNETRLQPKEVERMKANAISLVFREEDKRHKMRLEARNSLETYLFSVKQTLREDSHMLKSEERVSILSECEETLKWLDKDVHLVKDYFDNKKSECISKWSGTLEKVCETQWSKCYKRQKRENNRLQSGEVVKNQSAVFEETVDGIALGKLLT